MTTCLSGGDTFVLRLPVAILKEEQQQLVMLIARDVELNRLNLSVPRIFHAYDAEVLETSDEDKVVARLMLSRMLIHLTGEVCEDGCSELRCLLYDVITQQGDLLNSALGRIPTSEKLLNSSLQHNDVQENTEGIYKGKPSPLREVFC